MPLVGYIVDNASVNLILHQTFFFNCILDFLSYYLLIVVRQLNGHSARILLFLIQLFYIGLSLSS